MDRSLRAVLIGTFTLRFSTGLTGSMLAFYLAHLHEHGVKLTKALVDAGARAEMITVPGGKHGFPKEKLDELYPLIFEFLSRASNGAVLPP